ncbi:MAG: glycoside hydrolase family 3 C-terminal domain-containing protein, partial [Planctomycetota bacterium]
LSLKEELGLFESQIPSRRDRAEIGSTASNAASLEAARQGITLLRNGGSLPLGDGTRILVTGPTSDSKVALHGSWSYSWQGTDERLYPPSDTVLDAVRERFGSGNVVHVPGVEYEEAIDIDAAVRAARGVDVVLLCLGELPAVEKPGDFGSLMMSAPQVELAQALAATGKPVILSLVTNRPRILSEFESDLDSILWLGHAGPHGGTALAEILAGDVNPSGRLPFSYPRHPNALLTYDHKHSERVGADSSTPNGYDPLFQFGFGIGYSEIGYSGLRVRELAGGGVNVTVSVRNSGDRDAAEVVQVYVTDAVSSVTPRVKRLKAFERTEIAAGASDRVGFVLPRDAFMTVDRDGNAVFEPGEFVISVGGLTETIVLD